VIESMSSSDIPLPMEEFSVARSRETSLRHSISRVARLARKELRESLRDRRTLATLILMPLIVYPLLGTVVQKFAISRVDLNAPAAIVALDERLPREILDLFLEKPSVSGPEDASIGQASDGGTTLSGESTSTDADSKTSKPDSSNAVNQLTQQLASGQSSLEGIAAPIRMDARRLSANINPEVLVQEKLADIAILELPSEIDDKTGDSLPGDIRVFCRQNDAFSLRAAEEAEKRISEFRDQLVRRWLVRAGVGVEVMPTISRITVTATGPRESPLSAFVPLMLVLMTMTGAVYPAIDLTAGERERGTLEMLLAAPVSRRALLTGKFVAVFTVAVLTAIVNLTAMMLTLYGTGFDRLLLGDGVTPAMFLQVLLLLVVFASFFSAVLLCITSFARSFREAQAWLIPLMLVSLAPGILSLIPGVRLTFVLTLVPLVNIVLLGKELFQGIASLPLFGMTLLTTGIYAVIALRIAANVFGSNAILFGGNAQASLRSPTETESPDNLPFRLGVGYLILLAPAFVVLSGLRGKLVAPDNLAAQSVLSGVLTLLLFAVLPVLLTVWSRAKVTSVFALRGFSLTAFFGAVLLGITLWSLTYEVLLFGKGSLGWTKLLENPRLRELAQRLTAETPVLLRLLTFAAIPAVCEELFFRGFLLSALQGSARVVRTPRSMWWTSLFLTSFLFAAFHVIVDQALTLERFPATFLLGLVLGWIRLTTGSVIPGIVMHAVSNGLLLSLNDLQPLLQKLGLDLEQENQAHLPGWFLISAGILALLGAMLVRGIRPAEPRASSLTDQSSRQSP
jgi:sodium transport system permease protein